MPVIDETKTRMDDAVEATRREFATVRTGKAVPAIVEAVKVPAYGGVMPLNQVATVTAPSPDLLVLQPFDPSLLHAIEKAVQASGLGLNPSNDGSIVRVPVPPLSEERRREYVRLLHGMAEEGRVSVRRARHAANERIKARLKAHETGEDEAARLRNEVQKLTDAHCGRIDALLSDKEKEVMSI